MPEFDSKVTQVGNKSVYVLIPYEVAEEYNIKDGDFFRVNLTKLVPSKEAAQ